MGLATQAALLRLLVVLRRVRRLLAVPRLC